MNKDYENEFWYVIHSAGYFADTFEKRMIFKDFVYLISHLLPCEFCPKHNLNSQNATYILYNVLPLTKQDLSSRENLISWISEFRKLVQGKFIPPKISSRPKDFGPHWWFLIHSCSVCDTVQKRMIYIDMIKCLVKLIPCHMCSEHATDYVYEINPVELYSNSLEDLFYWTYLFHEYANDNTKVPKDRRLSFEEVCEMYL